jgi:uncharacterized iron-regulated protein
MAETVARALEEGHSPIVLVVGRFHVDFEGGTVQALRRMRPGARIVRLSMADADSAALREEDRGRAELVVYVGPSPAADGAR